MAARVGRAFRRSFWFGICVALLATIVSTVPVLASVSSPISSDPFTNSTSQHRTEVEPDTFSFGATIVAAFQQGRFFDGGGSDIGFATSTNGGTNWAHGSLPGITTFTGGKFSRVSDPSVAYDAKHNVWLISSLPLDATPTGVGVIVNRSANGGLTWDTPRTVNADRGTDKNWTVCDNTPSSLFYGNCYTEWDLNSAGNRIQMSTSRDGGLTWGAKTSTASGQAGIGGQPVVQPNGTVIVPIDNANETTVGAFQSTNGGMSWSDVTTIAVIRSHVEAGGLRSGPLPSAEIDGAGKVYVVWSDCRFRQGCRANDIVMSTSTNGTSWSAVTRVPIDSRTSGIDHFIPGIAVAPGTSGNSAHLGLTYYYYPVSNCSQSTCRLDVGFVGSSDGGAAWSAPATLAGPMNIPWLANTSQGRMVGDYISTSFSNGLAHGVFAVATAPSGGVFDEATYTNQTGLKSLTTASAADIASPDKIPDGVNQPNMQGAHTRH